MLKVTICPESLAPHMTQIYGGLYDLAAAGKVQIDFTMKLPPGARSPEDRGLLWMEVFDSTTGSTRKLCFDLTDSGMIRRPRLEVCDLYFKRSYRPIGYDKFGAILSSKILPYGLNYVCVSRNEKNIMRRVLLGLILSCPSKKLRQLREEILSSVSLVQSTYGMQLLKSKLFRFVEDFEVAPDEPCDDRILLQTRVWNPQTYGPAGSGVHELNQLRADLVRGLREHFGSAFVGGLLDSPYARKQYPDCVTQHQTAPKSYLGLLKRCKIAISTVGLYNSTPWKLAEYLAASRCIVSEPLAYELPTPLRESENLSTFGTVAECIQACDRLLKDSKLAESMRRNNYAYYEKHVKPEALVSRCLNAARQMPVTPESHYIAMKPEQTHDARESM